MYALKGEMISFLCFLSETERGDLSGKAFSLANRAKSAIIQVSKFENTRPFCRRDGKESTMKKISLIHGPRTGHLRS